MALIFCDGFDDGLMLLGKWFNNNSTISNAGRNGKCARYIDGGTMTKKFVADAHATVTWGMALSTGADGNVLSWVFVNGYAGLGSVWGDNGATQHVSICADYNGGTSRILVYRGAMGTGTLLGSVSIPSLQANQWYYFECQVTLSDTVGAVTVKQNGTTVVSLTGIDTKNGGTNSTIDTLLMNWYSGGWSDRHMYVDDLYITNGAGSVNNGFLGDIAVETLYPSGDGSSSQWVGSDGNSVNNSLLVDEATPDPADYVQSGTTGNRDLYAYTNLSRSAGSIYGVQVASYTQATDSGGRNVKNAIKSSSTTTTGTDQPVTTTYDPKVDIFETDPNTTAAWAIAGVNAAEFGVEVGT